MVYYIVKNIFMSIILTFILMKVLTKHIQNQKYLNAIIIRYIEIKDTL